MARHQVIPAAYFLSMTLAMFIARPACAQTIDMTDSPDNEKANVEILVGELAKTGIHLRNFSDPVWKEDLREGYELIQVPVSIALPETEVTIDQNTLKIRNARFVAWRFEDQDFQIKNAAQPINHADQRIEVVETRSNRNDDIEVVRGVSPDSVRSGLLPAQLRGEPQHVEQAEQKVVKRTVVVHQQGDANHPDQSAASAESEQQLPWPTNITPRLARKITLHANGSASWKLDRRINDLTVIDRPENPYVLLLDRQLLLSLNPAVIRRNSNNTDQRPTPEQRLQMRKQQDDYNQLRKMVSNLPTEYAVTKPGKLWAVFSIRERTEDLDISGASAGDWSVNISTLDNISDMAKTRRSNLDSDQIKVLQSLAASSDVYSWRLAGWTIQATDLSSQVDENEAANQLIASLLDSDDVATRWIATQGLLKDSQPGSATAILLAKAASDTDVEIRQAAINHLLNMNLNDPTRARSVLAAAGKLIIDPDGPDASQVLSVVLDKNKNNRWRDNDQLILLSKSLDLTSDRLSDAQTARLNDAAAFIITQSTDNLLAAGWVDYALLDSGNQAITRITLQQLAQNVNTTSEQPAIPIRRADHGLIMAIKNPDQSIRDLAWQALQRFELDETAIDEQGGDGQAKSLYDQLINAAMVEKPAPPQVAVLLGRSNQAYATDSLIKLATNAEGAIATTAAGQLIGRNNAMSNVFDQLKPDIRDRLAARMYEYQDGRPSKVTGLLRIENNEYKFMKWFASEVDKGNLPPLNQWSQQVRQPSDMMQLVASDDPLIAEAAVTALVAAAGGDADSAEKWSRYFADQSDRGIEHLTSLWQQAEAEISIESISHKQGVYLMVLQVMDKAKHTNRQTENPVDQLPVTGFSVNRSPSDNKPKLRLPRDDEFADARVIEVGIVELKADPEKKHVGFVGLDLNLDATTDTDGNIILQLLRPGELKKLANNQVSGLPLEELNEPLDLYHHEDGSWRGSFLLNDGRAVRLLLQPDSSR